MREENKNCLGISGGWYVENVWFIPGGSDKEKIIMLLGKNNSVYVSKCCLLIMHPCMFVYTLSMVLVPGSIGFCVLQFIS